jgi:hypothetical protein
MRRAVDSGEGRARTKALPETLDLRRPTSNATASLTEPEFNIVPRMSIEVYRAFSVVENDVVPEGSLPNRGYFRYPDIIGVLTNLPAADGFGPSWSTDITIGEGVRRRRVSMLLERFLTAEQHAASAAEPWCFSNLERKPDPKSFPNPDDADLRWLWLFRDGIYVTERNPKQSEIAEIVLRVKSLHFQKDEALKRLREQVSNFEAIQATASRRMVRQPIPDDVKLLVWSRDGGACVKCRSQQDLHFDHIIPVAKGGSDVAENIQLLCRVCNLAKSDRIA